MLVASLHSNMFLLIQEFAREEMRFNSALHSNMFLLIQGVWHSDQEHFNFTFQYVSINTLMSVNLLFYRKDFTFQYVSINTV